MIHFTPSKILIPVDFSATSLLAIKHGAFTAQLTKCDVYLLHVINSQFSAGDMFLPIVQLENKTDFQKMIDDKLEELSHQINKEYGVRVISVSRTGVPSKEINAFAEEIKASLIVMGTHGYSPLEELVIGSNALKVITKSPCPTMVMSSEADHKGYQKIVLPIDSSANSRQKVIFAIEFAKHFSAELHAVALMDEREDELAEEMELILHQIQSRAEEHNVVYHSDVIKNVSNRAKATVEHANKLNADLVIIMTDQDAELSGFFLGPYSQQVIHLSKVPTIAIKPLDLSGANANILGGTSGI